MHKSLRSLAVTVSLLFSTAHAQTVHIPPRCDVRVKGKEYCYYDDARRNELIEIVNATKRLRQGIKPPRWRGARHIGNTRTSRAVTPTCTEETRKQLQTFIPYEEETNPSQSDAQTHSSWITKLRYFFQINVIVMAVNEFNAPLMERYYVYEGMSDTSFRNWKNSASWGTVWHEQIKDKIWATCQYE